MSKKPKKAKQTHCETCGGKMDNPKTSCMYVCPDKFHGGYGYG